MMTMEEKKRNNFIGLANVDDLLKVAQAELLLNSIIVTSKSGATVLPSKCPAVGRHEDYERDASGNPACVFNGKVCKYFVDAEFRLEDYLKKIDCTAI